MHQICFVKQKNASHFHKPLLSTTIYFLQVKISFHHCTAFYIYSNNSRNHGLLKFHHVGVSDGDKQHFNISRRSYCPLEPEMATMLFHCCLLLTQFLDTQCLKKGATPLSQSQGSSVSFVYGTD